MYITLLFATHGIHTVHVIFAVKTVESCYRHVKAFSRRIEFSTPNGVDNSEKPKFIII